MTTVKVEEEYDIIVTREGYPDEPTFVVLKGDGLNGNIWLSAEEARELVKALKKHIKKAEGK